MIESLVMKRPVFSLLFLWCRFDPFALVVDSIGVNPSTRMKASGAASLLGIEHVGSQKAGRFTLFLGARSTCVIEFKTPFLRRIEPNQSAFSDK